MCKINNVCVLANRSLPKWRVEALERMVEETEVSIPLVVVNTTDDVSDPGYGQGASTLGEKAYNNPNKIGSSDIKLFFKLLRQEGAWTSVLAERKISWVLGGSQPELMRRYPSDSIDVLADAEKVYAPPVTVDGNWCDLPEEIVDRIVTETDLVIRFGYNLLTGRIISEPEFGVLSFHPADIRKYRGLGPARSFLYDDEVAGATLQQLTDEIDGGNVVLIENVDISDINTLDEIRERVYQKQIGMLPAGIKRLQDPKFELESPESLGPYMSVKKRQSPQFALRVLTKNVAGRITKIIS